MARDGRGERSNNRWHAVDEIEHIVQELDGRWRQPGVMGEETREAYLEALAWLGLSYATAGNPAGAEQVFDQIDSIDALALDTPLADTGLSPRQHRTEWASSTAEVRPLVLYLPTDRLEVALVPGERAEALTALAAVDIQHRSTGWFHPTSSARGQWVFTTIPAGVESSLKIGDAVVSLPNDDGAVVAELKQVSHSWVISEVPLPFTARAD